MKDDSNDQDHQHQIELNQNTISTNPTQPPQPQQHQHQHQHQQQQQHQHQQQHQQQQHHHPKQILQQQQFLQQQQQQILHQQQQQQILQRQQQQQQQQQHQQQHYQQQQPQQQHQQNQRPITSTELPRIPGFDPGAINEISQILRQSNNNPHSLRLSPAQINLWSQYRAKCESPSFNSSNTSQPKEPIQHPSQPPQSSTFHQQQQQYNQRNANPQIPNLNRSSFNLGNHQIPNENRIHPNHNGINPNGQPNQPYENRSSSFHPAGNQTNHDNRPSLNPNMNLINPDAINETRSASTIFNLPPRSASPFTPPPPIHNGHHSHSPLHHPNPNETTTANSTLHDLPSPPKTSTHSFDQQLSSSSPKKLPESLMRPSSFSRPPNRLPVSSSFTKLEDLPPGQTSLPKLTPIEQIKLTQWVQADHRFEVEALNDRNMRRNELQEFIKDATTINRQDWIGDRTSKPTMHSRYKIRMPLEDEREKSMGKRKGRDRLKLNKDQIKLVSEREELLVPIRLELEHEHWKLRDTFTWNLKEPVVTPEQFASHLCEDLILPTQHFLPLIATAIKEQLEDYKIHENFHQHQSTRQNEDTSWWSIWRENPKRVKLDHTPAIQINGDGDEDERDEDEDQVNEELRIVINLDIISGSVHLSDRFEWEISEPNNSPEEFAQIYINDLGLSGEFKTAVAHSIREQIEIYVKSLALVEHVHGSPVPNDELRYAFLTGITDPMRTAPVADDHTPFLTLLTPDELDRQEKEHDREARRKRRQTRARRGVTLPDRDAPRTARTTVPRQGMKMVMSYMDENEDTVVPVQPLAEPYPIKESIVELPDPSEHHPRKIFANPKDHHLVEPVSTGASTPIKGSGPRASRRLRGATADVAPSVADTPPPLASASTPKALATTSTDHQLRKEDETSKNEPKESATLAGGAKSNRPTRGFNWAAHGLHDPMINGVWHCSNCGCPDNVAVGRRKGLGGKDTLCGDCGRYMHRFKKNRPALWNTSADYHTSLKIEADRAKQAVADQERLRKSKTTNGSSNKPTDTSASKKRKKEGTSTATGTPASVASRPKRDRAGSGSMKSSRESSPVVLREKRSKAGLLMNKKARLDKNGSSSSSTAISTNKRRHNRIEDDEEEEEEEDKKEEDKNEEERTEQPGEGGNDSLEEFVPKVPPARPIPGPPHVAVKRKSRNAIGGSKNQEEEETEEKEPRKKTENTKTSKKDGDKVIKKDDREEDSKAVNTSQAGPKPTTSGRGEEELNRRARGAVPPDWMMRELGELRNGYPNDRVELIPKIKKDSQHVGWRLKCWDCPGKLYTVGPDESFSNFVVHLKNRQHRTHVDERIQASPTTHNPTEKVPTQPTPQTTSNRTVAPPPPPPQVTMINSPTVSSKTPQNDSLPSPQDASNSLPASVSNSLPPTPIVSSSLPPPPPPPNALNSLPPSPTVSGSLPPPPLPPPSIVSGSLSAPAPSTGSGSLPPPPPILPPNPFHSRPNHHLHSHHQHHRQSFHPNPASSSSLAPPPPSTLVHPLPKKPML